MMISNSASARADEMASLSLKSVGDGTMMKFFDLERSSGGVLEGFTVEVDGPALRGIARVDCYMSDNLGDYFSDLAQSWKGWSGEKVWQSIERELRLGAKCDSLGHITLSYCLSSGYVECPWSVTGSILLEAGQLERIAVEAVEVFRRR